MCGIVGYVGDKQVVGVILDGLKKLEYRGYDSAGIAVVDNDGALTIRRAEGKLRNLEEAIRLRPLAGTYGIGHTRWATHGRPTEENAHPHRDCSGRVVVVHNGIIENFLPLKRKLQAEDHTFVTETDTEVIAHLIEKYIDEGEPTLELAVRRAVADLRGIYALAIMSSDEPEKIDRLRRQSDLSRCPANHLGPDRGGEGRLQALHVERDIRAAAGGSRHDYRSRFADHRPSLPGRDGNQRGRVP